MRAHSISLSAIFISGLLLVCAEDSLPGFCLGNLLMLVACLIFMRRHEHR